MSLICDLPFDVWLAISSYLPVNNILNLSLTCKCLHGYMNERSIWSLVLSDILGIITSPNLIHALPSMSSQKLKLKSITMARRAKTFATDTIVPRSCQQINWVHQHLVRAEAVPGSDHIVTLLEGGTICLHSTRSPGFDTLAVLQPSRGSGIVVNSKFSVLSLVSLQGKYMAVVMEHIYSPRSRQIGQDFRIIEVDVVNPSLQLRITITKMNVFCDFDVQENLLAVMSYTDDGFCLIDIRKMGNLRNGPEEGIMMVLEPVLDTPPRLSLVCSHQVILSIQGHIFLYDVPSLQPIPVGEGIPICVSVKPVAVYTDTRTNINTQSTTTPHDYPTEPIWNFMCNHHSGRISLLTGGWDRANDVMTTLPPVGQTTSDEFTRTEMKPPGAVGLSQAIWTKTHSDISRNNEIELFTGAFSPRPSSHSGYMRMGTTKYNPNHAISHIGTIMLKGCFGEVQDMSFSEEDGRICLVCYPSVSDPMDWYPRKRRTIVIADFA